MVNNKPKNNKNNKTNTNKPTRRRRNNRRKVNKTMRTNNNRYAVARDPGMIIKSLAKTNVKSMPKDSYVCCRMGFRPTIPPTIPDGGSGKHNPICLYAFDTIRAGSATGGRPWNFILQTHPTLPSFGSVMMQSTDPNLYIADSIEVNGVLASSSVRFPIARASTFRTPAGSDSWPGAISGLTNPYQANGMRIVSIRHKIVYTGPAVACSGSVIVYPCKLGVNMIGETTGTTPITTGRVGIVYFPNNPTSSASGIRVGSDIYSVQGLVGARGGSEPGDALAVPATSQLYRPEQSITLVPKHHTDKYKSVPVYRTPVLFTPASVETGADIQFRSFQSTSSSGNNVWGSGVVAYDDDWGSVVAAFTGLNPDASFTVETCVCVEFTPNTDSAFYSLAKDPVNDQASFKRGHKVGEMMPPSMPSVND